MRSKASKLSILLLVAALMLCSCSQSTSYSEIEYRTDPEPVIARFPYFSDVEQVYWKASVLGGACFGPTPYSMTGFIIPRDADVQRIIDTFTLEDPTALQQPDGIDPTVTGCTAFEWHECPELSRALLRNEFVGTVYFDRLNGVVYFDVQNA